MIPDDNKSASGYLRGERIMKPICRAKCLTCGRDFLARTARDAAAHAREYKHCVEATVSHRRIYNHEPKA